MSESKIPPQMWPDREEIQKKAEFEAFKLKLERVGLERDKTLYELWGEAEESVKKTLGERPK